jgi:hypothetical protein
MCLLAACGGSGGGGAAVDGTNYVGLFVTTSNATSGLQSTMVAGTVAAQTVPDTIDRTSDRVTVGGLLGTIAADRQTVALDEGGTVTITQGSPEFVALFVAEPITQDPFIGVIGQPTALAGVPQSGEVAYLGNDNVVLEVIDGTDLYDLVGTGTVTVNFGSNLVALSVTDIEGSRTTGVASPVAVTDVAIVDITGATLSQNGFSGGNASISNSNFSNSLSGNEMIDLNGALFGPGADEIGGIVLIDDTLTGAFRLRGTFVAD